MNPDKRDESAVAEFDEITKFNRLALSFMGIWPSDCDEETGTKTGLRIWWLKFRRSVFFVLMFFMLVPQWYDMYLLRDNLDAQAETMLSNLFIISAMIKLTSFLSAKRFFWVGHYKNCYLLMFVWIYRFTFLNIILTHIIRENEELRQIRIKFTFIYIIV